MANQGVLYLSTLPWAVVAAAKPPNGNILLLDPVTLQLTATVFDPVAVVGTRWIMVFPTVPTMVDFLRDHPEKVSRLAGLHMHPEKVVVFQARRFFFQPSVPPEAGIVHLAPILHPHELAFRPRATEVALDQILTIVWEEAAPAIAGGGTTVVQLTEPDPDRFYDGSSKTKCRYAVEISMAIPVGPGEPRSSLYKTISDDSGLANFPKEFFTGNPLIHLDPPLCLVVLLGTPQVTTIQSIKAARRDYFRPFLDDEMSKGGHPWFDVALKMLENSTMAFFTLAITNPNQQPYDYEYVRPIIAVCRYLITGILRRAGRETQPPSSLQCRTPAWYHKDTEEMKKEQKAKKDTPTFPSSPDKDRKRRAEAEANPPGRPVGDLVYNPKTKLWSCPADK